LLLLVDNFDSFSFILLDYIKRVEPDFKVVRNDTSPDSLSYDFDYLVISPGPMDPASAGNLMKIIKKYLGKLPILGICLGHQALGEIYGARLIQAQEPVHGKTSMVLHKNDEIFSGIPSPFRVVRYHSLILEDLPEGLELIAHTESGEIMGFRSQKDSVVGLQFHPEAQLTDGGFQIIKNWLLSSGKAN
jgi:anthranilate synthase component II